MVPKLKAPPRSDTEIRRIILEYFYNRNRNATSQRSDKSGVAAKISVVYKQLKESHGLSRQEIRRNLTYLISEKWVEEEQVVKNVPLRSGTFIPQATSYYRITSAGIDKIEGSGEFTMPKYHGIKIEATGQNIITVGDGNQVDAKFGTVANALADLERALVASDRISDSEKVSVVADIETIQAQLAKREPNKSVIKSLWPAIERAATVAGLVTDATGVAALLGGFLS